MNIIVYIYTHYGRTNLIILGCCPIVKLVNIATVPRHYGDKSYRWVNKLYKPSNKTRGTILVECNGDLPEFHS